MWITGRLLRHYVAEDKHDRRRVRGVVVDKEETADPEIMRRKSFFPSPMIDDNDEPLLDIQEIRLPEGFTSACDYVSALVAFLRQYRWLSELHVVDFFTHRHWDLLDPEWRESLLPESVVNDSDTYFDEWLDELLALCDFDCSVVIREILICCPLLVLTLEFCLQKSSWPESLQSYVRKAHELALPRYSTKEQGV